MRHLHRFIVILFLLLLLALAEQKKAEPDSIPKDPYEKLVRCWSALQERQITDIQFDHCWRGFLHSGNIPEYSKPLAKMMESGLAPENRVVVRRVAIGMIGLFQNEHNAGLLKKLITDDDPLKAEAAHYLLKWGYWDEAAPVLREAGIYEDLVNDPRGLDLLRIEVDTSPPPRKLAAAQVLYGKLNLPDSIKVVARAILNLPAGFRGTDVTKQSVDLLSKDPTSQDLASFTRIAISDSNQWCRNAAFAAVVARAFAGDSSAMVDLESIQQNSPDAEVRSRAAGYIKAAGKKQ